MTLELKETSRKEDVAESPRQDTASSQDLAKTSHRLASMHAYTSFTLMGPSCNRLIKKLNNVNDAWLDPESNGVPSASNAALLRDNRNTAVPVPAASLTVEPIEEDFLATPVQIDEPIVAAAAVRDSGPVLRGEPTIGHDIPIVTTATAVDSPAPSRFIQLLPRSSDSDSDDPQIDLASGFPVLPPSKDTDPSPAGPIDALQTRFLTAKIRIPHLQYEERSKGNPILEPS
ncbi:hypothetical protein GGX14DRAFT_575744 [Mycena pura]|uniref:Uncharacterized protein n=1 Tax=Mycena pura TaxID=153505 RepID=A0AAD6UVA8_9AGAR|nr:hypothetical protein GGX14DRAFT_575744 [Mycena pura]